MIQHFIAAALVGALIFGLLVLGQVQRELVVRDCNISGGVFINGFCQKPRKGMNYVD